MYKTSILEHGAVSGTEALQTDAIQRAIDACFQAGGGEVIIPTGTFRTGGIRLRSHVTLHLLENAVLEGSRNPEDYMAHLCDPIEPLLANDYETGHAISSRWDGRLTFASVLPISRWSNALIRAIHATDIAIIGETGATINGRDCYDEQGEEHYRGPHAITMHDCHGVTLRGYTIVNSANWAHAIFGSSQIDLSDVTVLAGHDGAHFRDCRNVSICSCAFYSGDDCVAGYGNVNVYLADSILNTACSGMRFGATNALIERCRFIGPGKYLHRGSLTPEEKRNNAPSYTRETDPIGHRYNMLSAFTYFSDFCFDVPVQPGNILLTDCVIENTDRFLHFNFSGNEQWQRNRPLENLTFRNIRASDIGMALHAYGSAEVPFTLEFHNVDMTFRPESHADCVVKAANCARMLFDHVTVRDFHGDCIVRQWENNGDVVFRDLTCGIPAENRVKAATEPFFASAI